MGKLSPEFTELLDHLDLRVSPETNDIGRVAQIVRLVLETTLRALAQKTGQSGPHIELCFVRMDSIDAKCFPMKAEHHYGILVSDAYIVLLLELFERIMSHRECFVDIGDATKEVFSFQTIHRVSLRVDDLGPNSIDGVFKMPSPKCPERAAYAFLLAVLSVLGVVFHEAGHIVQGHVALKRVRSLDARDWQTLEDAADRHTASFLFNWTLFARESPTHSKYFVGVVGIKSAIRALTVLQFLHEATFRRRPTHDFQKHPHPRVRQMIVGVAAETIYKLAGVGTPLPFAPGDCWLECERAYAAIALETAERDYLLESLESDDPELLRHWQTKLRPELLPLAYADLDTAAATDERRGDPAAG
jgi:hypothetical protein